MKRLLTILMLICCVGAFSSADAKTKGKRMQQFHQNVNKNSSSSTKKSTTSTRGMKRGDRLQQFHNNVNNSTTQTQTKTRSKKSNSKSSSSYSSSYSSSSSSSSDDDFLDIKHSQNRLIDLKNQRKDMESKLAHAIEVRDKDPNATTCHAVDSYQNLLNQINDEISQHESYLRSKGKL